MNELDSTRFDDVVVGAGTSGAVVAARLSEDPGRRVLLVEAGPDFVEALLPPQLRDYRRVVLEGYHWPNGATMDGGRSVAYTRARVVGGGAAINAGIALRGTPADYDEWSEPSGGVWSWKAVLPWLRALEDDPTGDPEFHGVGGPIPIKRWTEAELVPIQHAFFMAARALGHEAAGDLNLPGRRGVASWPMNLRGDARVSTALAYLEPARGRVGLTIAGHTEVSRVLVERGRVVGLAVRQDGRSFRIAAERVTLCAGAIGSPELLLHSGIGPADELRGLGIEPCVDLPGVGANLAEHAMVPLGGIPAPGACDPTKDPTTQVGVRYTAPGSSDPDDMQIYCTSYAEAPPALRERMGVPYMFMLFPALARPRSRGRVRLDPAAPQGPALVELCLLADPEDERRLVHGLRHVWELLHTEPLASRCARVLYPPAEAMAAEQGVAAYVRGAVQPIYHPVGTARMGTDGDAQAVVDAHGRVRGVEGLWVADASVMPTIPRVNTNLSCMMIGERIASWLREG
jgi:choline dehydrogenase